MKNKSPFILTVMLMFLLTMVGSSAGRTITVDDDGPADFNNIQAAIDDSNDGDIIIVADGTYTGPGNRDIDFLGKAITVRSNDPNVVAVTIIDCDANRDDRHRGFNFHTGEDANSILNGLTIINAYDRHNRPCGGGISCYQSSPTIINCHISSNFTRRGAGIGCQEGNPTISNCIISDNNDRYISTGGGIFCEYSNATITNCIITNNGAHEGGGVFCGGGNAVIINCTITGNTALYSEGGGVCCFGSNSAITNCTITNNRAYLRGGGIFCWRDNSLITNCTVSGNVGGGINCDDSDLIITSCTISSNSSGGYGGGLSGGNGYIDNCVINGNSARSCGGLLWWNGSINNCIITGNWARDSGGITAINSKITNCTITGNSASEDGGGLGYCNDSIISNCIIWNNFAPEGAQLYNSPDPNYSCIQDWLSGGVGNIDLDPCFVELGTGYWDNNDTPDDTWDDFWVWVEGDYHLLEGSPCIDAGDPNFIPEPNETDLDGNPRVVDGDSDGNSVVDMGAYEWIPGPVDLIAELLEEVGGSGLPGGIENSLMAKLNAALAALEDENENNDAAAINTLGAFINAVETQRGKKIPQAQADALIAAAQQIIDLLNNE